MTDNDLRRQIIDKRHICRLPPAAFPTTGGGQRASFHNQFKTDVLGLIFYNIFLFLFRCGVRIAAVFNKKAGLWASGRKHIFERLEEAVNSNDKIIWMHCASLGEFEQGRPVLEQLRATYPAHRLLITFFSPSGYEIRKNYNGADWVFYLPLDGRRNARRFLDIINPELVVFVKYEYWYHYLTTIRKRNIPLLMVSAIFRADSPFFKWYGSLHRKMLHCFTHLFVQNQESADLLSSVLPPDRFSKAGDTRFDRVIDIAEKGEPLPLIEAFTSGCKTVIAGSSWPVDEALLQKTVLPLQPACRLVLAPHEIHDEHIKQLTGLFPGCLLYSQLLSGERKPSEHNVLVIDNIGLLSRIYRYAHTCYVGGGLGTGLHNTLEAAVYGKPVIFGTNYKKFMEAIGLIDSGGAFSIANEEQFSDLLQRLLTDQRFYEDACSASRDFVFHHKGATGRVLGFIQEKRLLIS